MSDINFLGSIDAFEFEILDIKNETEREKLSQINEVYFFWKSFWPKVLNELESDYPHWADEFYSYSHVGVLFHNGVPVSLHLYKVHNLKVAPCHAQSYFDPFPKEAIQNIKEDNHYKVLTAGWSTVNSDYAKNDLKVSFIRCQLALSLKVSQLFDCSAIIGPTRMNNGFAQRVIEWGAKSYGKSTAYNTPVELILIENSLNMPLNETEKMLINKVWKYDIDKQGLKAA